MSDPITTEAAASLLGIDAAAVRSTLRRYRIEPVGRATGKGGANLYNPAAVRAVVAYRVPPRTRVDRMDLCAHPGCGHRIRLVAGGVGYCSPGHIPADVPVQPAASWEDVGRKLSGPEQTDLSALS